ncbi:MAG: DUF4433 domain-containing protein [Pseudorhodoplanes sp.]|nr:DUF4433 domain-containing protein [Pseudorhodoplanes sp.]
MPPPANPKIYHIVHVDRLGSIIGENGLLCDAAIVQRGIGGTTIGMKDIKSRRFTLPIKCHQGLCVGSCVPFYFCPRSIMLYLIYRANHPELSYRGGQGPILHLEADLHKTIQWANANGRRWAFTLSNAGSGYFEDRCNVAQLGEVDWTAIQARNWSAPLIKEGKQAEFLIEQSFPWQLVERISVIDAAIAQQAANATRNAAHRPTIEIKRDWYY